MKIFNYAKIFPSFIEVELKNKERITNEKNNIILIDDSRWSDCQIAVYSWEFDIKHKLFDVRVRKIKSQEISKLYVRRTKDESNFDNI